MILLILLFACINGSLFSINEEDKDEELILLDSIASMRIGASGLMPTFYSDSWFVSPFGLVKSLEEIIIHNLWLAYASEHGMKISSDGASNEYAEGYFDMLQEKRGVTRKNIEDMAKEYGYTITDVRKELNNQYLVQQTIDTFFAASGSLNVSNNEIVEYYNNFPMYEDESFVIESGMLPINYSVKIDMSDKEIIKKVIWSNKPYFVYKKDLNDNFENIDSFFVGDIIYYEYLQDKKEFLCYRLLEKKELRKFDLDDVYEEIINKLQALKHQNCYKKMTEQFLLSSNMIYGDGSLRQKCIESLEKNNIN